MKIPIDPIAYLSQYLRDHADQSVSLQDMSRITGYSTFHLQRKFKAALGVSPKQFHAKCRMERMKTSLRRDEPVTTAIYEAGFGSPSRLYERVDSELGMTPTQYKARGNGVEISYVILTTALGKILIAATDRGLCSLQLADDEPSLHEALRREFPAASLDETVAPFTEPLRLWQAAIEGFVSGRALATGLPMDIRATAFQATVWQYLQKIPAGQTQSYSEVASGIGRPTASRAVARACASNPVALAIPCHRVIRNTGELGGYRWGIERKAAILTRESRDTGLYPPRP